MDKCWYITSWRVALLSPIPYFNRGWANFNLDLNNGITKAQIDFLLVRAEKDLYTYHTITIARVQARSLSMNTGLLLKTLLYVLELREKKHETGFDIGKLQDRQVQQTLHLELT